MRRTLAAAFLTVALLAMGPHAYALKPHGAKTSYNVEVRNGDCRTFRVVAQLDWFSDGYYEYCCFSNGNGATGAMQMQSCETGEIAVKGDLAAWGAGCLKGDVIEFGNPKNCRDFTRLVPKPTTSIWLFCSR
jgi:hypothetical protein